MPAPTRALHAERFAAFLDIGHHEELGMAGQVVLPRLHDVQRAEAPGEGDVLLGRHAHVPEHEDRMALPGGVDLDRKSTRLNSSHSQISYAVFCLKKKKK